MYSEIYIKLMKGTPSKFMRFYVHWIIGGFLTISKLWYFWLFLFENLNEELGENDFSLFSLTSFISLYAMDSELINSRLWWGGGHCGLCVLVNIHEDFALHGLLLRVLLTHINGIKNNTSSVKEKFCISEQWSQTSEIVEKKI